MKIKGSQNNTSSRKKRSFLNLLQKPQTRQAKQGKKRSEKKSRKGKTRQDEKLEEVKVERKRARSKTLAKIETTNRSKLKLLYLDALSTQQTTSNLSH